MTRSLLLLSLATGALMVPVPASSAATELSIREINVRPAEPVVTPDNSIRLLVDVVARGARGKNGVTISVEPGTPPGPVIGSEWQDPGPGAAADMIGPPAPQAPRPQPRVPEMTSWPDGRREARGEGWETWRFLPDKALTRYYPAGTWTVTATARGADGETLTRYASFQLRRETKLSAVQADKASGSRAVRLTGSLNRVNPRGYTDYSPFAEQQVEIQWRKDEASAWERAGAATTTSEGTFTKTIANRTGGSWRVQYPGTSHYAPDFSKTLQIAS
ncbi:hypothetical protein ABZ297_36095 [Nonomuraea sp. NPDC005983]|uniref:hypothetical protein n=1 Tax=Nonomuraea sp. NPDC005983 TaxID=3155595 RepID=UPI0033ADCB62